MLTDTTFLSPQTVISNGLYTGNAWTNPNNLLLLDGQYASTPSTSTLGSDVVVGNFLFNVPANSLISGIEISFTGYRGVSADPATALEIYAYDNTNGSNFFYLLTPIFSAFTTAPITYYFGSPSFLFNTTWTVDQINNLKIRLQGNGELFIDGVQVRITYQAPGSSSSVVQNVCESIFQAQPFKVIQPISSLASDVVWLIDKFQTSDGVDITNADIISPGIPITVDEGTQNEENDYVTAVQSTAGNQRLVTVTRGWSFRDPNVQGAPLRQHAGGSSIEIANSIQFYDIFLRKCQIGTLVAAPIESFDEGVSITTDTRSLNFVGAGVIATGAPHSGGGKDITITIPGFTTTPSVVESSTAVTSGGTQVNTLTQPFTVGGVNRMLAVEISMESSQTVTALTWNGVTLVLAGAQNKNNVRVEFWTLIAPDLGTHNLVATLSGLSFITVNIVNYNQVDQSAGFTFTGTASGTTALATGSVTTTTDNAIVVQALATKDVTVVYTAGGGESLVSQLTLTGAVQGAIENQSVGTAATVTTNINLSISTDWATVLGFINGIAPVLPPVSPVETQDEGITVEANTTILNFIGAGVTATSGGAGIVNVTIPGGGGGTGSDVELAVNQVAHGFSVDQIVRASSTNDTYVLSQADVPADAEVVGIVKTVVDADNFVVLTEGFYVMNALPGGAVAGDILFLSNSVAGALTTTEPTTGTTVSKPLAAVISAATKQVYFHNYRGQNNQLVPTYQGLFKNGQTTKDPSDASATQNIAHGLPTIPKKVRITAQYTAATAVAQNQSFTVYNGTTQSSTSSIGAANNKALSTAFRIGSDNGSTTYSEGVLTFDATNIIIAWTKTGSPSSITYNLLWEAEA